MKFIIKPLIGVNDIKLGMSKAEVINSIGVPIQSIDRKIELQDLYYDGMLQVLYDSATGKVHFIELYYDLVLEKHSVVLGDIDVFNTPKDKMLIELERNLSDSVDIYSSEYPNEWLFRDKQISLWTDDLSFESFKTVGVGAPGYLV